MSKTTVTSIAILLIILPFIVFTLKSKNISYGFRYGYECSCFGIVKPANDNYAEVNKCYGIPFNCIGYAQNAPNFVLKLLLYCLPALIFLCGIFIKRKIASKIFSSGIDNIKRIVNKKNIIIIFVIIITALLIAFFVEWRDEIRDCYYTCHCPCECVCTDECRGKLEKYERFLSPNDKRDICGLAWWRKRDAFAARQLTR